MTIPFTQYILPNGRRRDETIDRPAEIEALADRIIQAGGRFECEMLTDLKTVSLTVVHKIGGEEGDIAIVLCKNGPDIPDAVDRLVRQAAAYIGADR